MADRSDPSMVLIDADDADNDILAADISDDVLENAAGNPNGLLRAASVDWGACTVTNSWRRCCPRR